MLKKILKWIIQHIVIASRDRADPFRDRDDIDAGSDGDCCGECGIKVEF